MKVTIKKTRKGEHYLDLNDFKNIVDVSKVVFVDMNPIADGGFSLQFFDKDKNVLIPENTKLQSVLDNFDFEKVHKVMKMLKWTWRDEGIPSVDRLKGVAEELLKKAKSNGFGSCGSGGFMAYYFEDTKGYALEFTIERWDEE